MCAVFQPRQPQKQYTSVERPFDYLYPSLSAAVAALGLAERQGVGIDRMVSEMLSIGRPAPVISEVEGPNVRVALFVQWATARGRISSAEAADLGGISPSYANRRLAALAGGGELAPVRQNMRGRGFHYLPAAAD